jgi:hypothetical protein
VLAAHDRLLDRWPVPREDLDVDARFGSVHVLASGPVGPTTPSRPGQGPDTASRHGIQGTGTGSGLESGLVLDLY